MPIGLQFTLVQQFVELGQTDTQQLGCLPRGHDKRSRRGSVNATVIIDE
jgi:hypothetical protein